MADTLTLRIEVQDDGSAVIKDFRGNVRDLSTDVDQSSRKSESAFSRLNSKVTEFGKSTAVQMGMTGALGAVVGFTAKSITSLASFNDKMIDVQKTTGMSSQEIADMGDAIRKMATEDLQGLVGADQLAGIAEQAGQMGTRGSEAILDFTKAVAKIDVATDLTAQEAAENLGSLKSSFQASLEESGRTFESFAENIGSSMNALSAENNATVSDIMEVTRRLAGASSTIGLSIDEAAGLAATIKNAGIDIEVGGTAMTKFMLKLVEDSGNMAEQFGLDADQLASALKTKPIEAVQMVLEAMGELGESEGPGVLSQALNETVGADTRLKDALLKLSQATVKLDDNLDLSATSFTENVSLQDEFTNKAESNVSKWQGIGEKSNEVFRSFGEELKPATDLLTDWAAGSLDYLLSTTRSWRSGLKDEFFDAVVEQAVAGDGVVGMLTTWGQGGYDTVASMGEAWGNAISFVFINPSLEQFGEWVDSVAGIFGGVTDILVAPVELAVDTIDSLLGTSIAQMATEMAEGPDSASQSFRNLYDELETTAVRYGDLVDANEDLGSTAMSVLDELTSAIDDPAQATDDLAERTKALTEEIRDLGVEAYGSSTYPDMTSAILESREASEALNDEIAASTSEVVELGAAYDDTNAAIEAKQRAVRDLERAIRTQKTTMRSASDKEKEALQVSLDGMRHKKDALRNDISLLKEQAQAQKTAADEGQASLDELQGSLEDVVDMQADLTEESDAWAMAYAQHALDVSYANEETGVSFQDMAGSALDSFDSIAGGLGELSGSVGKLGDLLGIKELGSAGDFLGDLQQYAEIPGMLGDIGSSLGGLMDGLGSLGGIGDMLGSLTGGLGGLGSSLSSLTSGLGGLGGSLAALGPAAAAIAAPFAAKSLAEMIGVESDWAYLGIVPGILADLFSGEGWFSEGKSVGAKASEDWQEFVSSVAGPELAAGIEQAKDTMDFSDQFASLTDSTFDLWNAFANTPIDGTTTGLQKLEETMIAAGVPTEKLGQVAIQTFAGMQTEGMSAAEMAQTLADMIGLSAPEAEKLAASMQAMAGEATTALDQTSASAKGTGISIQDALNSIPETAGSAAEGVGTLGTALDDTSAKLQGTATEGEATTNIFDQAGQSVDTLKGSTDILSGSLGGVTGMLMGTGEQGTATNNVFVQSDQAVQSLNTNTGQLAGSLGVAMQGFAGNSAVAAETGAAMLKTADDSKSLSDGMGQVTGQTDQAKTAFSSLRSEIESLPTNKTITVTVKAEGGDKMATGGIVGQSPIIYNELGMEAAKFPGGEMALLTQPGPTLGVFPVGTEIIPHTRVPSLLRQNPHIPRMATGGMVQPIPMTGDINITIQQLVVQGNMRNKHDMKRIAQEVSWYIAHNLQGRLRVS